jgi:hypothetical protein
MKKLVCVLSSVFFLVAGNAGAALIDVGGKLLVDETYTGSVWYSDHTDFGSMNYAQQLANFAILPTQYDVNSDGAVDSLTWGVATASDIAGILMPQYYADVNRFMNLWEFGFDSSLYSNVRRRVADGRIADIRANRIGPGGPYTTALDSYGNGGLTYFGHSGSSHEQFGLFAVATVEYATPEPTTLALMGLGLAMIGYRRRKLSV